MPEGSLRKSVSYLNIEQEILMFCQNLFTISQKIFLSCRRHFCFSTLFSGTLRISFKFACGALVEGIVPVYQIVPYGDGITCAPLAASILLLCVHRWVKGGISKPLLLGLTIVITQRIVSNGSRKFCLFDT